MHKKKNKESVLTHISSNGGVKNEIDKREKAS
jgi:hypothetical protein